MVSIFNPQLDVFRIGLVINPVAGLGGPAGLKGSDDPHTAEIAAQRGVVSHVQDRVLTVFENLHRLGSADEPTPESRVQFVVKTASGAMGAEVLSKSGTAHQVLYQAPQQTTAQDTVNAATALKEDGIDLLLFAGGDGTARDICRAIGEHTPVLGIPAGVKMHSGVFAVTPESVVSIVRSLLSGRLVSARPGEVRDIDEAALARGQLKARYFGELLIPDDQLLVQKVKCSGLPDDEVLLADLAAYVAELTEEDEEALWILGPGGTLREIKSQIGIEDPTLLGVDLWYRGECVVKDAYEDQVLDWATRCSKSHLLLSVIGGQGVVLGRGNQQISPRVIDAVGLRNLQFVATQQKLRALEGRPLQVDTGSSELDQQLQGYHKIICGYEDAVLYPVGIQVP